MTEINHNKRLSEVLSHAKCPRRDSRDKDATVYFGDNYSLRCSIVGTNGREDGIQVCQKKIKDRLSNMLLNLRFFKMVGWFMPNEYYNLQYSQNQLQV
jgi:hypothetical protein